MQKIADPLLRIGDVVVEGMWKSHVKCHHTLRLSEATSADCTASCNRGACVQPSTYTVHTVQCIGL